MRRKQFLKKTLSVTLAAAMALTVSQATTFAETDSILNGISSYAAENNETYKYVYAGLTWSEYWKSEGVYEAENVQSSDEQDSHGEYDKGAFDAVSRATTNHGIHRGSFQCSTAIYDKDGNTYNVLYWKNDAQGKGTSSCVLTDGSVINFVKGTITYTDAEGNEKTSTMDDYIVTGIKYVPVAVKADEYEAFKEKYITVENGEKLAGGYSENNLKSFEETANVTENTNGLKVVTKNEDGSFTFGKRQTGTDSGILDKELVKDEGVTVNVLESDDIGAYGEFMRVDLKGNYGDLGSRMQAVRWTYYGNDAEYKTPVISYGTKFAADNWMHKVNGIQLGLTDSIRCQIPKGYDGTGYWKVTVYVLGHEDYEFTFNATSANVKLSDDDTTVDTTELAKLVAEAAKLNEKDYTQSSWKVFTEEFDEAKAELANPQNQATVNEAIAHLTAAMNSLEKVKVDETTNPATTNPSTTQKQPESKNETTTNPQTTTAVVSTPKAAKISKTIAKKKSITLKWKAVKNVKGYEIQVATDKKFKKNKKTISVNRQKATSYIVKKLKAKKTYNVRIRTYKIVNGNKIYSAWSKTKSVKTK
ncbi:penicillin-binding Tp47 domain C-containing protein [Eubacterium sp.]